MVGLMVVYLGRIREKKSPKNKSKFLFLHLLTAILGHRLKLLLLLWCHPIVLATTSFVWIPHATSLITGMWHISTILRGLGGRLIQFTIARIHIAPSLGTPSLVLSRFLSFLAAHAVSVIVPGLTISCKVGRVIYRGVGIQSHCRLAIQTRETYARALGRSIVISNTFTCVHHNGHCWGHHGHQEALWDSHGQVLFSFNRSRKSQKREDGCLSQNYKYPVYIYILIHHIETMFNTKTIKYYKFIHLLYQLAGRTCQKQILRCLLSNQLICPHWN